MVELIFLGTGAAWGIPEIGCNCPACFEARRNLKWRRTRSSFLIKTPKTTILIDATTDLRAQLLREKVAKLDAVIITHAHPDHFLGLDEFRARNRDTNTFHQVPLYVGEEAWHLRIGALFEYLVENDESPLCIKDFLYPDATFSIGEWTLRTFPTRHGDTKKIGKTFGFVVMNEEHKIIYTSDYYEIIDPDQQLLSDADLFIIDSTWLNTQAGKKEVESGHLSFEQAWQRYISVFKPRNVILSHISHNEGKIAKDWEKGIRTISRSAPRVSRILLSYDGFRLKLS